MTQTEIQNLAQSLVDIKKEIRILTDEVNVAKLDLYDNARDGIQCDGGRVKFMERSERKVFKKEKLQQELFNKGLSSEEIDTIIENSKETLQIDENIYVYLD